MALRVSAGVCNADLYVGSVSTTGIWTGLRGGLMGERLVCLVEQADVRDRNDGLRREGRQELELPLVEGTDLGAAKQDRPDRLVFAKKRRRRDRSVAPLAGLGVP